MICFIERNKKRIPLFYGSYCIALMIYLTEKKKEYNSSVSLSYIVYRISRLDMVQMVLTNPDGDGLCNEKDYLGK